MINESKLIECRDVGFAFGNQVVFSRLTFDLRRGEYLVISGPARSGKTTLVQLLMGLVGPESGLLAIRDEPIGDIMKSRKRLRRHRLRIGGVGGIYGLLTDRTVLENISLGAEISGMSGRLARKMALGIATKYRLTQVASHYPDMISEVERRLTQIARAEASRKELLIADTPTDGLDDKSARFINERLATYHTAGAAILYLTTGTGPQTGPQKYLRFQDGGVVE